VNTGQPDSVWLRPAPERARRGDPLTRERIVAAAVQQLDAHGVEKLTMRRLAQQLDVTATALYWHVATKDDVLDLALDHIFGDVPIPHPSDDLRADLRSLLLGWRAAMLRHPWSPALLGRPLLGPNVLARTEFLQSTLARGGLADIALATATHVLASYVIGAAMTEVSWRRADGPASWSAAHEHVSRLAGRYPTLSGSGHFDTDRWPDDDLFRRGVDDILAALPLARS